MGKSWKKKKWILQCHRRGQAQNHHFSWQEWPLRLALLLTVLTATLSLVLFAVSFAIWSATSQVHGWLVVIASACGLSGLHLLVLGIIGEYLGRLFEQAQGRPLYVVDEIVRGGQSPIEGLPIRGTQLDTVGDEDVLPQGAKSVIPDYSYSKRIDGRVRD